MLGFRGEDGIVESGLIQRLHGDIQAAGRGDGVRMEFGGVQYARVALGLKPIGGIEASYLTEELAGFNSGGRSPLAAFVSPVWRRQCTALDAGPSR